jgi:hypothetical protein
MTALRPPTEPDPGAELAGEIVVVVVEEPGSFALKVAVLGGDASSALAVVEVVVEVVVVVGCVVAFVELACAASIRTIKKRTATTPTTAPTKGRAICQRL